jgi:hypothetical protein
MAMLGSGALIGGNGRMRILLGLRMVLALLVTVLLPVESGRCLLMPLQAAVAAPAGHHDDDHDGCRDDCRGGYQEQGTPHHASSSSDDCCCSGRPLPLATAADAVALAAPDLAAAAFATMPSTATIANAAQCRPAHEPDARSGSPPESFAAPQAPRGPPITA